MQKILTLLVHNSVENVLIVCGNLFAKKFSPTCKQVYQPFFESFKQSGIFAYFGMIFACKKIEMDKKGKVVFIAKIICTYYKNGVCFAPWKIENCPVKAYKCKLKKASPNI